MSERELATDVYVHNPAGGTEHLVAGTKESDLPEWVAKGKARNARGEETDVPLLADDVWADPDADDPLAVVAGPGDDGFTFGLNDPLFVESETDETELNVPEKSREPARKTTRRG